MTWAAVPKSTKYISEMLGEQAGIKKRFTFLKGKCFLFILINFSSTKKWKVMVGTTASGPWTNIGDGEFPDPRPDPNNIPLYDLTPYGYNIPMTYQVSLVHLVLINCTNLPH